MKVITCVVNNPIFISFQYNLLKKFMPISYEFIVFNDAKSFPDYTNFNNPKLKNEIIEMCNNMGIKCINISNDHHQHSTNASIRHTDTLRFIKEYMEHNSDMYLMIDSDMFPIYKIDIEKYSQYCCGAIILQQRDNKKYMWPNLFFFDTVRVPDFNMLNWDTVNGCDTGGMSHQWLDKQEHENPSNIYYIKHLCSCGWNIDSIPDNITSNSLINFLLSDQRNMDGKFWCEIYDNTFLHYRAGSNWNSEGLEIHNILIKNLTSYISTIL
jgi:hypothetical protein